MIHAEGNKFFIGIYENSCFISAFKDILLRVIEKSVVMKFPQILKKGFLL